MTMKCISLSLGAGRVPQRSLPPKPTGWPTSCPPRSFAAQPSRMCRLSLRRIRRPARWPASTSISAMQSPSVGVKAEVKPVSVEARVPEVKLGRVDITVANLAYTQSRAEQIQFSDPYYLAKEMLIVKADDPWPRRRTSTASALHRQRARRRKCRSSSTSPSR